MPARLLVTKEDPSHRRMFQEGPRHCDRIVARHTIAPWSCRHDRAKSEIEAYVEASGQREIIATLEQAGAFDAEQVAEFIIRAVNDFEKTHSLLEQMTQALENCLACDLTWEVENEADILVRRGRKLLSI
jgi:hypothetical protein